VRILASVVAAVLAFGTLFVADVAPCRADAPGAAITSSAAPAAPDVSSAPRPGTDEEERAYARREAESPAAQEFTGGWVIGFLVLVALIVIIVLLLEKGRL
jgi:hypothetical protein